MPRRFSCKRRCGRATTDKDASVLGGRGGRRHVRLISKKRTKNKKFPSPFVFFEIRRGRATPSRLSTIAAREKSSSDRSLTKALQKSDERMLDVVRARAWMRTSYWFNWLFCFKMKKVGEPLILNRFEPRLGNGGGGRTRGFFLVVCGGWFGRGGRRAPGQHSTR